MGLLSIKVFQTDPDHYPLKILVSIKKPFESEAPSELPFEEHVALRAVLKALEATSFIGGDFTEEELDWLRRENLVGGSPGNFYYSHKMRDEIGQRLFGCLFPTEKMRGIYDHVRRESSDAREEIHFQLCFSAQAPLVGSYPWELLYHEGDFLIGGGRGTLTRYVTFDTPPPFRNTPDKLRVLLIVPRPLDPELALLGYAEAQAVRQGVETAKGQISLEPQEVSSFSALQAYLSEHSGDDAPHIIHFDGHGAFGRRCPQCGVLTTSRTATKCDNPQCSTFPKDLEPQGYLAFQDNQGRTEYGSARAFADLLRQTLVTGGGQAQGGTRLVVLSACRSAVARGVGNVFNGVAQRLMDAGVPAVVAVQFSIRADAATQFAERFYERVAKRDALVTAVSWCRTVLGREGDQWYRPVLYLRWRDNEGGQLFARLMPHTAMSRLPLGEPTVTTQPAETIPVAKVERAAALSNQGVDFLLVTALEEERDAVLDKLPGNRKLPPFKDDIRTYFQVQLPVTLSDGETGIYRVILMPLLGMGRVQAATATADAMTRWHPRYIMLVGIAGGVASRGVNIGDILIADQIVDYELQKLTTQGPQIRWEVQRADPRLLNACHNFMSESWQELLRIKRPAQSNPKRYTGPIASGDKVIAFGEVLERYREVWPKLIGVEMEAAGVATAAFQSSESPGFFMVRCVSDSADEHKDSVDVGKWRSYACDAAASFAIEFLKSGPVPLPNENIIKGLGGKIRSKENELKSLETAGDDSLRSKPQYSDDVRRGFAALEDLIKDDPVVHREVVRLCTGCEAACQQIEVVRDYKDLHDWLHELQFRCYNPLEGEAALFPGDDKAVDNVMDHKLTLTRIIRDLKTVAERRALGTSRSSWLLSLAEARDTLAAAIEHKEAKQLKDAVGLLRRVLKVQPDRVNTALKEAARATDLPGLVEQFRRVHDYLADKHLDPEKIGQFRKGFEALDTLSHNLSALVTDHDKWQDFDVELWGIEDTMGHDVAQLVDSWPYLKRLAEALSSNNNAEWATSFKKAGDDLNRAIAKGEPVQIKRNFRLYRRQAADRFYRVDTDLKKRCDDLRDIGKEFTAMIRLVQ